METKQQPIYLNSVALEEITGVPASTWRYWAHISYGPPSFRLGRRRLWDRESALAWIAEQEAATTGGAQ